MYFPLMVRKPLESHFYLTQANVFLIKSSVYENGTLFSRFLLFKGSVYLMCLNLVTSYLLMAKNP